MKREPAPSTFPEGRAIIYCEGALGNPNGKTTHGLIRFTKRYEVLAVIDSCYAGRDAGEVLDGKSRQIPIFSDLGKAIEETEKASKLATHLVIGLAPDGGKLSSEARKVVIEAIQRSLHVDSGLHDFLSDDPTISRLAKIHKVHLRDIRKPPQKSKLHFFSGKIEEVDSFTVALLGTDSAVGKRTTAWLLTFALREKGVNAELIGTGQTAWMQGVDYGIILDSLVNDFVTGEIEHCIWRTWKEKHPRVIVLEGQGSLLNPAYPGGFELLAAGRPDAIVLQHTPARKAYDGFPQYPLHPLQVQIEAIELISQKPVVAITINSEGIARHKVQSVCEEISKVTKLPAYDLLLHGSVALADSIMEYCRGKDVQELS